MEEALTDALQGAERVRKIVHALRTLARVQVDPPKRLDLHATMDHALEVLDPALRQRARIVKDYGPPMRVLGDETRLSQVFLHLIANAIQAIPAGQPERNEIHLVTRRAEDGRAIIEVRDSGHGIAPEHLRRIFDPFFTTKEVGEGTGLGPLHLPLHHRGHERRAAGGERAGPGLHLPDPPALAPGGHSRCRGHDCLTGPVEIYRYSWLSREFYFCQETV